MIDKTILIADDSESIRTLVRASLESAGYNVLVAENGLEAIQMCDGTQIDLIITDLNMPERDGIQVVEEVRQKEQYKFVPILLLTTESQIEKKNMAKGAGATGWIVKPFVESKLIEIVKKVLR